MNKPSRLNLGQKSGNRCESTAFPVQFLKSGALQPPSRPRLPGIQPALGRLRNETCRPTCPGCPLQRPAEPAQPSWSTCCPSPPGLRFPPPTILQREGPRSPTFRRLPSADDCFRVQKPPISRPQRCERANLEKRLRPCPAPRGVERCRSKPRPPRPGAVDALCSGHCGRQRVPQRQSGMFPQATECGSVEGSNLSCQTVTAGKVGSVALPSLQPRFFIFI